MRPAIVALFALTLWIGSPARAADELHFSCLDFPPLKIAADPQGRKGIDLDIIDAALARVGLAATYTFMPWRRAFELTVRGDFDGLCGCSYAPERAASLRFSQPITEISAGVFALEESRLEPIDRLDQLRGQRVAVVDAYALSAELESIGAIPDKAASDERAVELLARHRTPFLYGCRIQTEYWYAQLPDRPPLFYREISRSPNHLCLSAARPDADRLIERFDEGLSAIRADGTEAAIRARYGASVARTVN